MKKHQLAKIAKREKQAADAAAEMLILGGGGGGGDSKSGSAAAADTKSATATATATATAPAPTATAAITTTATTTAAPAPANSSARLKKHKSKANKSGGGGGKPKPAAEDLVTLSYKLFCAHYNVVFSEQSRWTKTLLPALQTPTTHVALINRYFVDLIAINGLNHDSNSSEDAADIKSTAPAATATAATAAAAPPPPPPFVETEIERQMLRRWKSGGDPVANDPASTGGVGVVLLPGLSNNRCFLLDSSSSAAAAGADALAFPNPQSFKHYFQHSTLLPYYCLDPSSVVCAEALAVRPTDRVLDLCCAPGGKALSILSSCIGFATPGTGGGHYQANELSLTRLKRLQSVLSSYLPPQVLNRVSFTHHDATESRSFDTGRFDRVLVDAPCSSERHLLHAPSELVEWTVNRTKSQSERQLLILMTAYKACKPGGRIVYATCALSPLENDGLIAKFIAKLNHHKSKTSAAGGGSGTASGSGSGSGGGKAASAAAPVRVVHHFGWGSGGSSWTVGRPTEYGWSILPDDVATVPIPTPPAPEQEDAKDSKTPATPPQPKSMTVGGFGPMYVCVLQKAGASTVAPTISAAAARGDDHDSEDDDSAAATTTTTAAAPTTTSTATAAVKK